MTVESRLWPGSSAGKGRVWSIWTHFAPPIAWLSLTGGGERVFPRLDSPSLLRALVVDRCFGGVAGVSPVFGWCLPRGSCRSYGSSSRVLAEERTGWSRTSNDGRWIFSCLARPRLDCCTRSQIRVGALRARTGPRGKGDEPVSWEEFDPDPCPLREREAGGVRAIEAIGVGTGEVSTDLLGLDGGFLSTTNRCSKQRQSESHGPVARPADGCSDRATRL